MNHQKEITAIVAFSFGLERRSDEPSICNRKLGESTISIISSSDYRYIVISQWEIDEYLKRMNHVGLSYYRIDLLENDNIDSQAVWDDAKKILIEKGINKVIVVAHPFLQLGHIRRMIRRDGFTVVKKKIDNDVGFNKSGRNMQPWTKSRMAALIYFIRIKLGFKHGNM